ncbi:MAG: ribosome maturation factor RimM [Actinomycetota bacterium]|nr:ribosome maturation factor RimM [Actinomycetota bacterium]MDK1104441.1 ribosome maturation factor RimM [Actinomycetota bacterium]
MTSPGHDRIPAGYVRKAHGIRGDVLVRGTLQDAEDRFVVGAVLVTNEDDPREFEVAAVRGHQGDYIVTLVEISDRNAADALRGVQFTIDRSDRRELAAGEWWPEDLVSCDVVARDGKAVGSVVDVITGASQDRLVVETPEGVRGEVPFVSALVPEVDIDMKRIVVDLPEGLFE